MCDESPAVRTLRRNRKYLTLNFNIKHNILNASDQLINNYPHTYLQVVFQYFRTQLDNVPNFAQTLLSLLCDFGWMPRGNRRLDPQTQLQLFVREWAIWRGNDFYLRSILPPTERADNVIIHRAMKVHHLPFHMQIHFRPHGNSITTTPFRNLFDLLKDSVLQYRTLFLDIPPEQEAEQVDARAQLVYYITISFATTLYEDFCHQVTQLIPAYVPNLNIRFQIFFEVAIVDALNRNPQERDEYLRFALGVLLQCPWLENGDATQGLRQDYCNYLIRLGVFQREWQWPTVDHRDNQYRQHFNQLVNQNLLLDGWVEFLQRLNIMHSVRVPTRTTNGWLIGLLVDSMRSFTQAQGQFPAELTAYDVRNQIIWSVAVAPTLLHVDFLELFAQRDVVY